MTDGELQPITGVDASPTAPLGKTLLVLNNAHAQELSWLEPERLQHLVHDRIVCEVNARPPNPESDAFNAALGFVEVGSASIHNDSKTVRYLSRALGTLIAASTHC
jgi:predicted GNAT superfamily acetyltransferase